MWHLHSVMYWKSLDEDVHGLVGYYTVYIRLEHSQIWCPCRSGSQTLMDTKGQLYNF